MGRRRQDEKKEERNCRQSSDDMPRHTGFEKEEGEEKQNQIGTKVQQKREMGKDDE
jgi:hypothetical protein